MTETEWLTSTNPQAMLEQVKGKISDRKLRLFACACCRQVWHLLTDERSHTAVEVAERYADGLDSAEQMGKAWYSSQEANELAHERASSSGIYQWRWAATFCCGTGANWNGVVYQNVCARLQDAVPFSTQAALLREIVGNPFRMIARWQPDWGNEPKDWDIAFPSVRHFDTRCLTPTVLSLAQAAYDDRVSRKCERCGGKGSWWRCPGCRGEWAGDVGPDCFVCGHPKLARLSCPDCHGTGRLDDGTLDGDRLAVLADALEDAGCEDETILTHLRSPGPFYRGDWVLDLILGKE